MIYSDRIDAGNQLATYLLERHLTLPDIVLGLPRGGVPVARIVAQKLGVPLDVFVVRKIGMPHHEELAIGAIGPNYKPIFSPAFLQYNRLNTEIVSEIVVKESREIDRRLKKYRQHKSSLGLKNKRILLVDDGLATGSTMLAACQAAKEMGASVVDVAVPVASREALSRLADEADHIYCLETPEPFFAVGQWYFNFDQTSDHEVMECLQ